MYLPYYIAYIATGFALSLCVGDVWGGSFAPHAT